ncbi:polysaccharide deacetylase family protein [Brevundimonas sp.]|uniref:polysaccharide deacetylase family protein n=1 Tax=Brevundimonas sp. TaxID=1871086 RepID=UPI002D237034|nr:polysaccharide deacetylase family protein [Brevundimonas sp.]HYC73600.1 polysaccharide deacetylase family protein [Brevundimonas sp.]
MSLTIVMYHYVRDPALSRYPAVKARTLETFRGQLDHIAANYEVVTAAQVAAATRGEDDLPDNACWLTFDDGYLDHYQNVFPLLEARGWEGAFFAPARPILEGRVLDVNKIHFILASEADAMKIVEELRRQIEKARELGAELRPWDDYVAEYMTQCHLDTPEVLFIKLMLQKGLPEAVRNSVCEELFARFVSADEAAFASELYLSVDQARTMIGSGMVFGGHGYAHEWLGSLDAEAQARDIDRSLEFLRLLGVPAEDWSICYPYGSYNQTTVDLVRERGCALGLTTREGVADLGRDGALELPRVDTIFLPTA